MEFELQFTPEATAVLSRLESARGGEALLKKVRKSLAYLSANPRHPGLSVHLFHSLQGPQGQTVWEAYVENQTPGAWRIWFWYGPDRSQITVLTLGPHPD